MGACLDTGHFALGLQFDLIAAKKIPTNYSKLTFHANFKKLIVSLHNIIKIIFFQQNIFTWLLWTLGTNLPPKTDIFVTKLDLTTKRLKIWILLNVTCGTKHMTPHTWDMTLDTLYFFSLFICFCLFWYLFYYPHKLRDLVFPVCRICNALNWTHKNWYR